MSTQEHGDSWDFFVSYTASDRAWAEWIAWQLEDEDYRVLIQAWDMVPGDHWMGRMDEGVRSSRSVIALLSQAYLTSVYGRAEWEAAFRSDPRGQARKVIPIRIEDCPRPTLLGGVVSFDLYGLDADATRARLLDGISATLTGRAKPLAEPAFPNTLIPPVLHASPGISSAPEFPASGPALRAARKGLRRPPGPLVSLVIAGALIALTVLAWGYLDSAKGSRGRQATPSVSSTSAGIATATLFPLPTDTAHLDCTVDLEVGSEGHRGVKVGCQGGGSDYFFSSIDCERLDNHFRYHHKGKAVKIGATSEVWCDLNAKVIHAFYTATSEPVSQIDP